MALKLDDKKAIAAEVAEVASKALSAVVVDYRGLKVSEMTAFRARAREMQVYLRVVRNTLARRAVGDTDFACLGEILTGPVILAFSLEDPGAAARLLREFLGKSENLVVKGIAIGKQLLGPGQLDAIANLPTRDEALSLFVSCLKAPITRFVSALRAPITQLHRAFEGFQANKQ